MTKPDVPEGFISERRIAAFKNIQSNFDKLGNLKLDDLIDQKVMTMTVEDEFDNWLTIESGFQMYIGKDLCWCQFAQVNNEKRPHGIARIIKENGVIREGNFADGRVNGWIREINDTHYICYWQNMNKLHGFFKNVDLSMAGRLTRFYFQNGNLVNKNSIDHENKEKFERQRVVMKDHQ